MACCDWGVSASAGLALRSSVMETIGNRMQMIQSKASSATADRRASMRARPGALDKSNRAAPIPAQTRLSKSSKVRDLNA